MVDVYLDEKYIGKVENSEQFIDTIREERRKGKLPSGLNISYNKQLKEIYIDLSRGRAVRPLVIVENGVSKLTKEISKEI